MIPLKIGIMGDIGSACEIAAAKLCGKIEADTEFFYLISAREVVDRLDGGEIDCGVFAAESPIGVPVQETAEALKGRGDFNVMDEVRMEVNQVVLAKKDLPASEYTVIVSHPVPLRKHRDYLKTKFPRAIFIPEEDSGLAARKLSDGHYDDTTLVVSQAPVAQYFRLHVVLNDLPGNRDYMSLFQLIERRSPGAVKG
jgi:prephenate dehydratase